MTKGRGARPRTKRTTDEQIKKLPNLSIKITSDKGDVTLWRLQRKVSRIETRTCVSGTKLSLKSL